MEPWLSLLERPDLELMRELSKFGPSGQVGEFRRRDGHAAEHFVSAETREKHAVALLRQKRVQLRLGWRRFTLRGGEYPESPRFGVGRPAIFLRDVNVQAGSPPPFLDLSEEGTLTRNPGCSTKVCPAASRRDGLGRSGASRGISSSAIGSRPSRSRGKPDASRNSTKSIEYRTHSVIAFWMCRGGADSVS